MSGRPEHANPVLAAALRYARANWPVFPCAPDQKVPATRHGLLVAPPSHVAGRPYELLRHEQGQAGLDWADVTRLLDPQPQHRPGRSAERPADASRLIGWVARLPGGNRNDSLFWAANRVLESGLTDLGELAEAARKTGLEEREIARTLASARRLPAGYGLGAGQLPVKALS